MAAISAIAIASAAVSAIGTGVQMHGANKAAKRAKGQRMTAERKIADLESKRQIVINPYEGITDMSDMVSSVSGMASNPFANLSVSTAAAEMQVEEADIALANTLDTLRATGASAGGATALARMALESKKGVSASIEQQEAQNQKYRAQGEERLQNVKMEDEVRVQGAKIGQKEKKEEAVAKGLDYKFKTQESSDDQQLNRAQGIASEASKNEASALNARSQALSSGISAVGKDLIGQDCNLAKRNKMAKDKNFQSVSKEANQIWNDATYGLVEETSATIKKAKANMSESQKEAAEVQRFVSARYFKDQDAAAEGIKRGGVRNPSLSTLGNDIIWGIYHSSAAVENATDKKVRQEEGERVSMLEKSLSELYTIIEIGKESDPMFMNEYFGLEESMLPGQPGGMALVGGDTQKWCKTMVIRNGLDIESAKEEYYIGDTGGIRLRYSGGVLDGEIVDKPAVQWLSYDPGIIQDITAQNIKMLQTPSALSEEGEPTSVLDKSSQYNPTFLLKDDAYMLVSDDGKTQTEFIPANMPMVIASIKPELVSRSNAILQDYTQANVVWRNNFNKEEDLKFTVAPNGNNVDEKQQAEFQKLMFESVKPLLPPVAMGATTEVVKEEIQPEVTEVVEEELTVDQFN